MNYDNQNCKCNNNRFNLGQEGRGKGDVEVLENKFDGYKEDKLKNKSSLEVVACGKKHKIDSNEVEARKINLIIKEEQNCDVVFAGDEIEYKVKIFNDSHVAVCNIEFDDVFSECGEYKKDSFKVNGCKEHPHVEGHHIKFKIDEIKPHQEIIICFEIYFKY